MLYNFQGSSSTSQNLHWIITTITGVKDIDQIEIDDVLIYPNPVVSTTTIQNAINSTITIYDMNGSSVFTQLISSESEVIDLSRLATGIYYREVIGSGLNSTVKLVKN